MHDNATVRVAKGIEENGKQKAVTERVNGATGQRTREKARTHEVKESGKLINRKWREQVETRAANRCGPRTTRGEDGNELNCSCTAEYRAFASYELRGETGAIAEQDHDALVSARDQ